MLNIKQNISLKKFNTFGVGGSAKYFFELKDKNELVEVFEFIKKNNLNYYIIGGGTNLLVSEKGFDGLVILNKLAYLNINQHKVFIEAGSGISVGALANKAKGLGFSGLEWSCGLPGTLGGAIFGNAGTHSGSISDIVDYVLAYDSFEKKQKVILKSDCDFGYRKSVFQKKPNLIILGAGLKFKKEDPVLIMNKMAENFLLRKNYQPLSERSEGCIFKNIILDENVFIPEEIKHLPKMKLFIQKKVIPAGFLIDISGLKGYRVGGAHISKKHANFIIAEKDATADDIYILIQHIKKTVKEKYGFLLSEEIRLLGF